MKTPILWRSFWALPSIVYVIWLLAGMVIFFAPEQFYASTPGVVLIGPFNAHFIRDVGLVYVTSGVVGLCGVQSKSIPLCTGAALWSCMHAVFHLHGWVDRGWPIDSIFLFDLSCVIAPPFLTLFILLTNRAQPETSP